MKAILNSMLEDGPGLVYVSVFRRIGVGYTIAYRAVIVRRNDGSLYVEREDVA
jgi:hypothetical protein